ncbi:hypothetical protein LR48_Vigan11g075300 [Vigna angularis]|uniref:Uncharacterized protein n=1 Tax=Phaseolus angularis TaxID=3914 RepID=A0A0L9VRM1_PHAAN|nr:hypothetical protein LR48_Vigan11g075300 [Vigna angularis]
MVAIFLIQRNRHALIGRAMNDHDMEKVLHFLKNDPVVIELPHVLVQSVVYSLIVYAMIGFKWTVAKFF